jgi:hypothetical protein
VKLLSHNEHENGLSPLIQCHFGYGISKVADPKKQDFWPKINILEGNQ